MATEIGLLSEIAQKLKKLDHTLCCKTFDVGDVDLGDVNIDLTSTNTILTGIKTDLENAQLACNAAQAKPFSTTLCNANAIYAPIVTALNGLTPITPYDYSSVLNDIKNNTGNINLNTDTLENLIGLNTTAVNGFKTANHTDEVAIKTSVDAVKISVDQIVAKLGQACTADGGIPINVKVCNPSTGGGSTTIDLTDLENLVSETNELIDGLSDIESSVSTNTGNTVNQLVAVNTKLTSINTLLARGTNCGNPQFVSICNQLDISGLQTSMASIDTKMTTLVSNTGTIITRLDTSNANLGNIQTSNSTIATNTGAVSTKLDSTNTALAAIQAKLTENCAGNPLVVTVCNPGSGGGGADFTVTNGLLTDIKGLNTIGNTNTSGISTKIDTTNSKLDTANTSLSTIATKLGQNCAGTPLVVTVCNPTAATDLTTTNTILGNILTQDTGIHTDTTSIDSKLSTTNSNLATIASKLTQTCAGTPLVTTVCNQISLAIVESELGSINDHLNDISADTTTIVGNTADAVDNLISIGANTSNTVTALNTVNSNITSLKTQLTQADTNHTIVDNFPVAPVYNINEQILLSTGNQVAANITANFYHSISITVIKGNADITYAGYTFTAPEGYTNTMEATTKLTNGVIVQLPVGGSSTNIVIITTIR